MSTQAELRQRGEHAKQQGKQVEKDMQEGAEQVKQQVHSTTKDLQHTAEQLLDQGSQKAHQLVNQVNANPKLQMGLLVLTAFLMGMALTGMVGKLGYGPAGSVWKYTDPQSLQAHQALDVLLEQAFEAKRMGGEKLAMAQDKLGDLKKMDKSEIAKTAMKEGAKAYMGLGLKDKLTEGVRGITNKLLGREEHVPTMSEKLAAGAQNLKERITGTPVDNSLKGRLHQAEDQLKELLHSVTGM